VNGTTFSCSAAALAAAVVGISLPGWTLISFVGFALYAILSPVLPQCFDRRPA